MNRFFSCSNNSIRTFPIDLWLPRMLQWKQRCLGIKRPYYDVLGSSFLQFPWAPLSIGAISLRRREMNGVHSLSEPPTLQADTHLTGRYASRKWQALASRWPNKWGWHWSLHWWSCHLRCHIFSEELERQTNTQRWDSVSVRHCWNTLEYSLNSFYGWLVLSDLEYGPISLVYLESLPAWGFCFENS